MPVESNYALERILALQQAAKQAAGGFGTGLKNQAMGLAQMLGNPLQTLGGALEGAHSMVLNSRPAEQAMRQYLAQSLSSPQGMGQLVGENIGPGELVKALMGAKALGGFGAMTAYHGSPHKFDKFDSSKIGTGEGAQAYGHGLYFAEDPRVAGSYKKNVSFKEIVKQFRSELPDNADIDEVMELADAGQLSEGVSAVVKALRDDDWLGFDYPSQAINAAFNNLGDFDASPALRKAVQDYGGHLYNVDIPDEAINKMLDWDAPLSEQPDIENIMRGLDPETLNEVVSLIEYGPGEFSGKTFYGALEEHLGSAEKASQMLREMGIPGIRYLDAGSRQSGKGTRNFVVFDDSILKILKRE